MIEGLKREGVTVLLSSHLLDQVQRICDRVALFQGGRIVLMGAVDEIAQQVIGSGFVVEIEAGHAGGHGPGVRSCAPISRRDSAPKA